MRRTIILSIVAVCALTLVGAASPARVVDRVRGDSFPAGYIGLGPWIDAPVVAPVPVPPVAPPVGGPPPASPVPPPTPVPCPPFCPPATMPPIPPAGASRVSVAGGFIPYDGGGSFLAYLNGELDGIFAQAPAVVAAYQATPSTTNAWNLHETFVSCYGTLYQYVWQAQAAWSGWRAVAGQGGDDWSQTPWSALPRPSASLPVTDTDMAARYDACDAAFTP